MAQDEPFQEFTEELKDIEVAEEQPDNAADLTSGLVMVTFGILLLAIFVMEKALANYFDVGFFGGGK